MIRRICKSLRLIRNNKIYKFQFRVKTNKYRFSYNSRVSILNKNKVSYKLYFNLENNFKDNLDLFFDEEST